MYEDLTTNNKYFIKRFSHSKRFEVALQLLDFKTTDKFLDYGTGDGYMIKLLEKTANNFPNSITVFEPQYEQYIQLIKNLSSLKIHCLPIIELNRIKNNKYQKISCLEVLEHLNSATLYLTLETLSTMLEDEGLLIVSVPIESGTAGFLKNVARLLIGQPHEGTNMRTLIRSLFGIEIIRKNQIYIGSHIGFNHSNLEVDFLKHGFKILRKIYSPFPLMRSVVNSQIFYVLKKRIKSDSPLV